MPIYIFKINLYYLIVQKSGKIIDILNFDLKKEANNYTN